MISINTRATPMSEDYKDFGTTSKLSSKYDDFIAEDHKIDVIIEVTTSKWYAYFGNINLHRKDAYDRTVRLVLMGEGEIGDRDSQVFAYLLTQLFRSQNLQEKMESFANIFDKKFTSEFYEELNLVSKEEQHEKIKAYFDSIKLPENFISEFSNFTRKSFEKIIAGDFKSNKQKFLNDVALLVSPNKIPQDEKIVLVYTENIITKNIAEKFSNNIEGDEKKYSGFILSPTNFEVTEISQKKKIISQTQITQFSNQNSEQFGKNPTYPQSKKQKSSSSFGIKIVSILLLSSLFLSVMLFYKNFELKTQLSESEKKSARLEGENKELKQNNKELSSLVVYKENYEKLETWIKSCPLNLGDIQNSASQNQSFDTNQTTKNDVQNEVKTEPKQISKEELKTTESPKNQSYEISETDEYNLKIVKMVLNGDSKNAKELYDKPEGKSAKIKNVISKLKLSDEDRRKIGKALKNNEEEFF